MKDQHTLISGYRDLNQEEIDLMNEIKQMEAHVLALVEKCGVKIGDQIGSPDPAEVRRAAQSNAHRWVNIARTDLEKGFMALVRSVAQPQPTEIKKCHLD